MSKYRALITDIDNTLVPVKSDGSEIKESLRIAVGTAQSQGKFIATASGRGWRSTEPAVTRLSIVSPCIIEGGARIVDPLSGKTLWEQLIASGTCNKVIDIFKANAGAKELLRTSTSEDRVPIQESGAIEQDNMILYLLGTDDKTADRIVTLINKTEGVVAHKTTPSWAGEKLFDVHVTNPMGTKENAVLRWQKLASVTKEDTIGIGDSENDLPLFKSVGLKLAVGNATEGLKKQADQIVSAQSEDGVEGAINKFLNSRA